MEPEPTYSPLELGSLSRLRSALADVELSEFETSDAFLLSWLVAGRHNVDTAQALFRKSLQWRKANNVDGILERESDRLFRDIPFPAAYLGMDPLSGSPVILMLFGRCDMRGGLEQLGPDFVRRQAICYLERVRSILRACSEASGRPITSYTEIVDLHGYSLRQVGTRQARSLTKEVIQLSEANYPGIRRSSLVINAPRVFSLLFGLIRPFLPQLTLDRLTVIGPNVEAWQAAVLSRVPRDRVPRHWGGTRDGTDEYCSDETELWITGRTGPEYFR